MIVDFPYLIAYAVLLAAICAAVADRLRGAGRSSLAAAVGAIGWLPPIAAVLDAIENVFLLRVLGGHTETYPLLAELAAIPKWICALTAIGFILIGLIAARRTG